MKKTVCLCLALIFVLCSFGCRTEKVDPNDTLPPLSENEMETVVVDKNNDITGKIIGKKYPNVLIVKLKNNHDISTWGETVYVITDQANEWCVEDEIFVQFSTVERPKDTSQYVRIIAEKVGELLAKKKPIIYFYPEAPTKCSLKLTLDGRLTCTYPLAENGRWENFTAYPDGTLIFPDGKEYYALYWEGLQTTAWDFSSGFCVRGEDTAEFLEWALAEQGLTPREANEFIMYWLPLMQENLYNVISFQKSAYTDNALLEIDPKPETLIRVFMAYYPSFEEVEIAPQEFESVTRCGFTVVEWGGSVASNPNKN